MPALLRTGLLLCAAVQAPSAPVDANPRRDIEFASFAGESPTPAPAPPLPRFGAIIPGSDVVPPVAESYILGERWKSLDLVERGADVFNASLTTLRADRGGPGSTLFGDLSFRENGHGGISSYDVFTTPSEDFELVGLRSTGEYDDVWFAGSFDMPNGDPASFVSYSNQIAATCWSFTMAIRCQFNGTRMSEKGLGFVIGSGGWRDTDALLGGSGHHVCDVCPTCTQTDGIVSPQTPPPSTLQYIVSPVAAEATCCVAPADRANLAASFDGGCTPVELRASESVSADPASQAADTNASDAPTGDSLLGSAPLGIPDPNGNTYVFSKDVLDVSLDEARSEIIQAGYHCAAAPQASQSIRARHNALCQKAAGAIYLPGIDWEPAFGP